MRLRRRVCLRELRNDLRVEFNDKRGFDLCDFRKSPDTLLRDGFGRLRIRISAMSFVAEYNLYTKYGGASSGSLQCFADTAFPS